MSVLRCEWPGGCEVDLRGDRVSIGRGDGNDLVISDDRVVSRHHATVERRGDSWVLHDAHSRNGTLVNGTRVAERTLVAGDRISVGSWVITFVEKDDPQSTVDVGSNATGTTTATGATGATAATATSGTSGTRTAEDRSHMLSAREREVLALLADGATDHQIAETLFISVATVRSHLDRIRDKTGCRRRPALTRLAVDLGIR